MKRASLICCALLTAGAAYAPPAPQAVPDREPTRLAAMTVSECHVYAYLRDTIVTRQQLKRMLNSCTTGDTRPRDV